MCANNEQMINVPASIFNYWTWWKR